MRHEIMKGNIMKTLKKILFVAGMVLVLSTSVIAYNGTYIPGNGINNTPHDLGTPGKNGMNYAAVNPTDPLTRICIFCHAPHNAYRLSTATGGSGPQALDIYDYLPLWNHTLPTQPPTYTMYENGPGAPQSGPHASQAIQEGMNPGSTSLLCLSCHDGSIAVNSYGNTDQPISSRSNGSAMMNSQYQVGGDGYLGNHHPIGFNYDNVQSGDIEIRPADAAQLTPTDFVRDHLYGDGTMECGTCHSVHNKGNTGEKLLWRSDQNSELCLSCHDKGIYTPFN